MKRDFNTEATESTPIRKLRHYKKKLTRQIGIQKARSNQADSPGFGQAGGYDGSAGFDELLFGLGESDGEVAFNVEFGGKFFVYEDGDDDFGFYEG